VIAAITAQKACVRKARTCCKPDYQTLSPLADIHKLQKKENPILTQCEKTNYENEGIKIERGYFFKLASSE